MSDDQNQPAPCGKNEVMLLHSHAHNLLSQVFPFQYLFEGPADPFYNRAALFANFLHPRIV